MSFTTDNREGVQWPSLAETDPAVKIPLRFIAPADPPAPGNGLTLVAPRVLYDDGRLLAEAEVVKAYIVSPHLELSKPDAARLGITDGDQVTVSANNGVKIDLPARVNKMLDEGVVVVPRNLAGRPAEKLGSTVVNVEKGGS
jgi:predicted molibdopterin-dependent oxidoreductase YjgC